MLGVRCKGAIAFFLISSAAGAKKKKRRMEKLKNGLDTRFYDRAAPLGASYRTPIFLFYFFSYLVFPFRIS